MSRVAAGGLAAREVGSTNDVQAGRLLKTRPAWEVLGLAALLAAPVVVTVVAVLNPRWYPTLDYVLTEARVRDVGGRDTPLLGLPGRLGRGVGFDEQGHHPGPLSFLLLAGPYRLLGSSSWALQAATGLLNVVAMGLAVWLAERRGGRLPALAMATAIALLAHAYGPEQLVEPWNPYLPPMWWVLYLVALWSVLCDDRAALPVAVFAGTFCAQTHISYVGLVAGLAAMAAAVLALRGWRARRGRREEAETERHWSARWLILSAGLLVLLWTPPAIEQVSGAQGNLGRIAETLFGSGEAAVGLRAAVGPWLAHLDVGGLLTGEQGTHGSVLPGLGLLTVWLVSAVAASRLGDSTLQRLHLIVAGALSLGLISISRVVGVLFDYLMLWAWGTTTLLLVSVGWTAALMLVRRRGTARAPEADATTGAGPRTGRNLALGPVGTRLVSGALVAASVAVLGSQVVKASRADPPGAGQSRVLAGLVPSVVDRLEAGTTPGTGRDGRYLVGWSDPAFQQTGASGLLLALERHGLRVTFDEAFPLGFPRNRTMSGDEATARLTVVAGEPAISEWRRDPDVVEIAYAAARPADEAEFRRFRADLVRRLERAGRDDLVSILDENLFGVLAHRDTPDDVRDLLGEAVVGPSDMALPMAVFVEPLPSS